MGRWNKRRFPNPRRRNYESYYDNPPRSPPPSPPNPGIDDGVPLWEKNFCFYIGTIAWRKIVSAKMFMHCHANVVNWDDSASKEAFQNARTRYWADINGLPCDVSLPDRDMFIDEINWNPDIDPELIKDLELSFFAPPDDQGDTRWGAKSNKTRKLLSDHLEMYDKEPHSEGSKSNAADASNPWERHNNLQTGATLKDKLPGWNQWNYDTNNSVNLKTDDNPWESGSPPRDEVVKGNSWGDGNKLWGWNRVNKFDNWNNDGDRWKSTCQAEDRGWGNHRNSYNQQEPRKSNNGYNSWLNSRSYNQGSGISKNRGWRDNEGQGWGSKQYNNYHKDPNNLEPKRSSSCWGDWNQRYWESEGAYHQQTTGCRRVQFSGVDSNYSTAKEWSRGRNKKRVNFAID